MRNNRPAQLFSCVLFWSSTALSQPTAPPTHLDPINRTVWSDSSLGIRFTYPPVWQQATPTQPSSRVVVNWRLSKSKTLLATCYVETQKGTGTLAGASPAAIRANVESIANSALRNLQQRAPDARLVEARSAIQDGHPVVYMIREGTIETFDRKVHTRTYSMATSWLGTEVNFECATSVFGPQYTSLAGGQAIVDQVETGILHVLRTLQFDRAPR